MSNAQPIREPSMDEILASIRRIIESGDEKMALKEPVSQARNLNGRGAQRSTSNLLLPEVERSAVEDQPDQPSPAMTAAAAAERSEQMSDDGDPLDMAAGASRLIEEGSVSMIDGAHAFAEDMAVEDSRRDVTLDREQEHDPAVESSLAGRADLLEVEAGFAPAELDEVDLPSDTTEASSSDALQGLQPDKERPTLSPIGDREHDDLVGALEAYEFDESDAVSDEEDVLGSLTAANDPVGAHPFGGFDEEAFASELLSDAVSIVASDERHGESKVAEAVSPVEEQGAAAPQDAAEAGNHALLSEKSSSRVSASFEDLARVVRDEQMRTMNDTVQRMLRPMLQEWLDDNLPHIVERLVREEIERVARGGR